MVTRGRAGLVRALVLLVDHDKAKPCKGREYGASCAYDRIHLSVHDPRPFLQPLRGSERGMEDRQPPLKERGKTPHHLVSEGNLGDEVDHAATAGHHVLRHPEVHVGFSRPGDSEQVIRSCSLFTYGAHGGELLICQDVTFRLLVQGELFGLSFPPPGGDHRGKGLSE